MWPSSSPPEPVGRSLTQRHGSQSFNMARLALTLQWRVPTNSEGNHRLNRAQGLPPHLHPPHALICGRAISLLSPAGQAGSCLWAFALAIPWALSALLQNLLPILAGTSSFSSPRGRVQHSASSSSRACRHLIKVKRRSENTGRDVQLCLLGEMLRGGPCGPKGSDVCPWAPSWVGHREQRSPQAFRDPWLPGCKLACDPRNSFPRQGSAPVHTPKGGPAAQPPGQWRSASTRVPLSAFTSFCTLNKWHQGLSPGRLPQAAGGRLARGWEVPGNLCLPFPRTHGPVVHSLLPPGPRLGPPDKHLGCRHSSQDLLLGPQPGATHLPGSCEL